MSLAANIYGNVRGAVATLFSSTTDQKAALNSRGDLLTAAGLPGKTERVRMGNTFMTQTPAANHFTPVAAMPTTRAELVLFNGELAGGKVYVIEAVYCITDTSVAAAGAITCLGQMVPNIGAAVAAPTDNTSCLINSRSCKGSYGGKAKKAIANTAFGITDRWEVLPTSNPASASTSIGSSAYADLDGGFIVLPGSLFLVNAILSTAAGTAIVGVVWTEMLLDVQS